MRQPSDTYPEQIERLILALLAGAHEGRPAELEALSYPRREIPDRPTITRRVAGGVYVRDRFMCRYCGAETILTPIMELIACIFPDDFPFHPNWKGGQTHPAFITRSPVVDHVKPFAWGGAGRDVSNLVTACWPCNAAKADLTLDQIGWRLLDVPPNWRWRGLTQHYLALWACAGRPKPRYHIDWMAAVGIAAQ